MEVEVPPGAGALELELALVDREARVLLPAAEARLWRPAGDARRASLALAGTLLLLAASAGAFALGAGAFVSPAIASSATLALWLAPGILGLDPAWLPGRGVLDALAIAGRARVPASPGAAPLLGAAGLALLGLALAGASPGAWRRTR